FLRLRRRANGENELKTHSGTLPKSAASLANVSEFLFTTWSEASRPDRHAFVRLFSAGPLPIKICRHPGAIRKRFVHTSLFLVCERLCTMRLSHRGGVRI